MNIDPLGIALREIGEAKALLEKLILSSETFDYVQARAALKKLGRKVRELEKLHFKYQHTQKLTAPNLCIVDFKPRTSAEARN